jgi:protein TonB
MARSDKRAILIAIVGALLVHGVLGGGVGAAKYFGWGQAEKKSRPIIMIDVPPPAKLEAPPPEPARPEPPPEAKPEPVKPVPAKVTKAPPRKQPPKIAQSDAPPPAQEEPAPGPVSDAPPPPAGGFKVEMASPGAPGIAVAPGGLAQGRPGGRPGGTGSGGGGPDESTGTGKVVSLATVKRMPELIGEHDSFDDKNYPAAAKQASIEGKVRLELTIDREGNVIRAKVKQGLGYGLDQEALRRARTFKFKPALDSNDQPVATALTWTFKFKLPE